MVKKSYHVIAKSNGSWDVKRTGAERATKSFPTKSEAVRNAGKLLTQSGGGELIIHRIDGRVSHRDTLEIDPNPLKGLEGNRRGSNGHLDGERAKK